MCNKLYPCSGLNHPSGPSFYNFVAFNRTHCSPNVVLLCDSFIPSTYVTTGVGGAWFSGGVIVHIIFENKSSETRE
jgi:hypothetical protein